MRERDYLGAAAWVLAAAGAVVAALAGGDIRHYRSAMYAGVAMTAICLLVHAARALRRAPERVEDAIGAKRAWHQAQQNTARMDAIEARQAAHEAHASGLYTLMAAICEKNGVPVPGVEAAEPLPEFPPPYLVRESTG